MRLRDEETSENNTSFSIYICLGSKNAANTSRISAGKIVLQAQVRAHPRSKYRVLGKSNAEGLILNA